MNTLSFHATTFLALVATLTLMVGCGDAADNDSTPGQAGTFTATITGDVQYQTSGEALLRPNNDIDGSYHIRLGFNDPVEDRLLLDIVEIDGIPAMGVHTIHTSLPMSADALNIQEAAYWEDGVFHAIHIADNQDIEITASSSSRVEGNFSVAVEVQEGAGERVPATLSVSFEALAP